MWLVDAISLALLLLSAKLYVSEHTLWVTSYLPTVQKWKSLRLMFALIVHRLNCNTTTKVMEMAIIRCELCSTVNCVMLMKCIKWQCQKLSKFVDESSRKSNKQKELKIMFATFKFSWFVWIMTHIHRRVNVCEPKR